MILPDKHIRRALTTALNNIEINETIIPLYDSRTNNENPNYYILMSTQTNSQVDGSKCGREWQSSIVLDVVTRFEGSGNVGSRLFADDIAGEVIQRLDNFQLLGSSGLSIYKQNINLPNDLNLVTPSETIYRKIIRLEVSIKEL